MAEGWSNAVIAHRLWVTVGTVEERMRSMMTNLNRPEPGDDHRRVLADRLPGGALPGLVTAMTLAPARAECRWGSDVEALAVLLTAVVSAADAIPESRRCFACLVAEELAECGRVCHAYARCDGCAGQVGVR